jgi:hypothetical protein
MLEHMCPELRPAAYNHFRRLQVLYPSGFSLLTVLPGTELTKRLHEDLCVPLFADHITNQNASFD